MSFGGLLRQSTAVNVIIGPFVSSTDGDTEMTGLTIAQADVRLSKNAGADAQKNDATSAAHEGDGFYMCELDATDTDTVGQLTLWVHVATALAVRHDFQIVEEAVYDALFAGSALGYVANAPVNVAQFGGTNGTFASGRPEVNTTHAAGTAWGSGAITAASIATGAIDADAIADNAIDAGAIAADAITAAKLAADVTTEIQSGLATAAELAKVPKSDGTAVWNATAAAQIQSESADALNAYDPPTRAELTSDTNSILSKLLKYVQLMLRKDAAIATDNGTEVTAINADEGSGAGAFANTTDSQEAIRDNMGTAQTGDAFARLGAPAGASVSADVAAVKSDTAAILVDTGTTLQGELDGIQADTEDIQSRLPAALVSGRIDASVGAMENNVMTAAAAAPDLTTELQNGLATAAALSTLEGKVDAVQTVTDKLDTTLESAGGSPEDWKFTEVALENAPAGGGGGTTDWDATERAQIRHRLGIDGSTNAPSATPSLATAAAASAIETDTQDIQSRLPAALVSGRMSSDAVAISGSTSAADAVEANIANLDAQVSTRLATSGYTSPPSAATNASAVRTELTTELGRIDAAVSTRATPAQVNAEADQALADVGVTTTVTGRIDAAISTRATPAQVNAEADQALADYDAPTKAELDAGLAALNDISAADVLTQIQAALTTAVADSVPADGSRPSIAQAAYITTQFLLERAVTGTTLTIRKPDGSTGLLTLTLDDDTAPTSVTRSA